jgi:hypothetical protein
MPDFRVIWATQAGDIMIRASSSLCGALLLAAGLSGAAIPASADPANLLGVFGNWSAYSTGTGSGMTCYAMSKPRAMRPANLKRNDIYLMVSDWPGRKIKGEPEIVPGYEYKLGAPVALEIGSAKFAFFSRNDAKSGSAWLQSLNDGNHLLDTLNSGVTAVAIGNSARGTRTTDTYSLAGFGDAVAKIHAVCNM